MPREIITLACTECKNRNYTTTRNKKAQGSERLELKKFCAKCGKHVAHRETK
jgi:large subunit ribosomal protein L33